VDTRGRLRPWRAAPPRSLLPRLIAACTDLPRRIIAMAEVDLVIKLDEVVAKVAEREWRRSQPPVLTAGAALLPATAPGSVSDMLVKCRGWNWDVGRRSRGERGRCDGWGGCPCKALTATSCLAHSPREQGFG
jgi:hypothetical protein